MDDFFEYLVPIIVGAVYLLSHFFSKGSQDKDATPGHRPGRPDPEVASREQEIRDQIRRKIQERRQSSGDSIAEQRESPAPDLSPASEPRPRAKPLPVAIPVEPAAASNYESMMESQLRRIEATKAQAAEWQKKAFSTGKPQSSVPKRSRLSHQSASVGAASLRKSLKSPLLARRAIVFKEILDVPIALRQSAKN